MVKGLRSTIKMEDLTRFSSPVPSVDPSLTGSSVQHGGKKLPSPLLLPPFSPALSIHHTSRVLATSNGSRMTTGLAQTRARALPDNH